MASFSSRVLSRKRRDSRSNILTDFRFAVILSCVVFSGYTAWHDHRKKSLESVHNLSSDGNSNYRIPLNPQGSQVPDRVVINGEAWEIIQVDHIGGKGLGANDVVTAETDCEKHEIDYVSDENRSELRTNIMHEIFHAGGCLHGGDEWWNSIHPTADNHPGIYHLGDFTHSFLHDNRQFSEWLAED